MTRTRNRTLSIGSISTGTCIAQEIADSLLRELDSLTLSRKDRATVSKLRRELDDTGCAGHEFEQDTASEILDELTELAQGYTPDYCYLGNHPGDGADFGVWVDWDAIRDDPEVWQTGSGGRDDNKPGTLPNTQYTLEVNDHGNATLYRRSGRRWVEVWAVV